MEGRAAGISWVETMDDIDSFTLYKIYTANKFLVSNRWKVLETEKLFSTQQSVAKLIFLKYKLKYAIFLE